MKESEFLEHYGVKGMRWGVRREVGPDGLVKSSPYSDFREAPKKTKYLVNQHPEGGTTVTKTSMRASKKYLKDSTKYSKSDLTKPGMIQKLNDAGEKALTNLSFRIEQGMDIPDLDKYASDPFTRDYIETNLRAYGYLPISELEKNK